MFWFKKYVFLFDFLRKLVAFCGLVWCWMMKKIRRIPNDLFFKYDNTTSYFWHIMPETHLKFQIFFLFFWVAFLDFFYDYFWFWGFLLYEPMMWEKYLLLLMEYPFDEFEPPRSLRLFIPILSFLKSLSVYFIFYFLNLNYVLVLVVSIIFWRCRFVSVRCEMSGTLLCKDFRYIQSMSQVSIQSISSIFFFLVFFVLDLIFEHMDLCDYEAVKWMENVVAFSCKNSYLAKLC